MSGPNEERNEEMAFRRSRGYSSRAPGRRAGSGRGRGSYGGRRSYSAAPTRRRAVSRRAAPRTARGRSQQTVRIVLEGLPGSPVARRNPFERVLGAPQVPAGRPGKAKM